MQGRGVCGVVACGYPEYGQGIQSYKDFFTKE
jgi:hypothetical protein